VKQSVGLQSYDLFLEMIFKEMVGASRFGRQVPLKGAQSKRHFISQSHPPYSDGFTAGPVNFLTPNSEL
jgi:hypothetical protein